MQTNNIEFIKNTNKNIDHNEKDEQEFTVLLNGQKDLEDQLEEFKKVCETHDKHQRKRKKRRYYNLALMAKVEQNTSQEEVKRLIKNNTKTFLIDVLTNKPQQIEDLFQMIKQTADELEIEDPYNKLVVGMVLQITGDACRTGRCRNNCSLFLARGDTMTLTTNMEYRYSCFKEIAFIINLVYYLPQLQLNDKISIGQEVSGIVIKKLKSSVTICIQEAATTLNSMFQRDLEMALKFQVDFIALTHIRYLTFLKLLQNEANLHGLTIIGSLDLDYITQKMLDLMKFIKQLDYLWLTNLFNHTEMLKIILIQDVFPVAKCLKKSIIGSVPLEDCSDFKLYENHEFLWNIDCIYIEKSSWCNKYPLIVKKLLPIKNYRLAVVENANIIHDILTNCQSVVNFVIRTISSIECQAIFLYSKCATAAKALSRVEIYCPVFVILELDNKEEDINCVVTLSKNLNLRRNLRTILYSKQMNVCEYKPIDYGIEYLRQGGCLETGDFIITLEVGKENGDDHAQFGVDEDVVIMRAFYVPPLKIGEQFKCT
ncbi:uncharacterized protein ACRADG_002526 [Cochliomyia hominivorax]